MASCELCPHRCRANRAAGQKGTCGADGNLEVASAQPHFGEEAPLVGRGGSGTIFLSHCSLRCDFCINWELSQYGAGAVTPVQELAGMMLDLQRRGCHNINLVSPGHYLVQILQALDLAAEKGLELPLVYNTSSFERPEILHLLGEVVDIYLADLKFADSAMAKRLCQGASAYPDMARRAILIMQEQVGTARPDTDGLIRQGLMIRHLVMPNHVSGSVQIVDWIAENLPSDTYVNIMSQYSPAFKAADDRLVGRRVTRAEYWQVVEHAQHKGLSQLDIQGRF